MKPQDQVMALISGLIASWNELNPDARVQCTVKLDPLVKLIAQPNA